MISKLCYDLYKVIWKQSHMITLARELDSIKKYYEFLTEENIDGNLYTYDDYIEEFGYNGELYVCYEEFLKTEYLEDDFICDLLGDDKLVAMYYKDIKQEV